MLAEQDWTSLAILPAHADGSTETLVRSLAAVAKNLSSFPVSAITVRVMGSGSALALAALASHLRNRGERLWQGKGIIEVVDAPALPTRRGENGYFATPEGQLIIGTPSVVAEPVALSVIQAVDKVVLGVELGRTKFGELEQSIELIGRERIAGCCFL